MNLATKIKAMIGKALLSSIQADGSYAIVLLNGEQRTAASPQQYGVKSRPPIKSKQVVVFPNGERDEGIVIVTDNDEGCPSLVANEMAIFTKHGNSIHLHSDGTITITGNVLVKGDVEVQGDIEASGDVSDGVGSMQEIRDIYNGHAHTISGGSSAGTTTVSPDQM